MRIGVIGAGAGGMALAFDLVKLGHEVLLFDLSEFESSIFELQKVDGVIRVDGLKCGEARVTATMDWGLLAGCEIIFVVTVARAHPMVAIRLAPLLRPPQIVVYMPGNLGSLYLREQLAGLGQSQACLLETNTLPYGVRKVPGRPSQIHLPILTPSLVISGEGDAGKATDILFQLCPSSWRWPNLLSAFLSNPNPLFHPLPCLLNAGRIQFAGDTFDLYQQGITSSVEDAIQSLNLERVELLRSLHIHGLETFAEFFGRVSVQGSVCEQQFLRCGRAAALGGPDRLQHRYLFEDTEVGLVCWEALGKSLNVPTPVASSTITLISTLLQEKLRKSGEERVRLMKEKLLRTS